MRFTSVILASVIVLVTAHYSCAQRMLDLIDEQTDQIQDITSVVNDHVQVLQKNRQRVMQGQMPTLPDLVDDVEPATRKLKRLLEEARLLKGELATYEGANKTAALEAVKQMTRAAVLLQQAQDKLEGEVGIWLNMNDASPELLEPIRIYLHKKHYTDSGMILPALDESGPEQQRASRFSKEWLKMAETHGVSKILDVLILGDSSEDALEETKNALQAVAPNAKFISVRDPEIDRTRIALAPSVPAMHFPEFDSPGEQRSLLHLNTLVVDLSSVRQPTQMPVPRPMSTMPSFSAGARAPRIPKSQRAHFQIVSKAPEGRNGTAIVAHALKKLRDNQQYGGHSFTQSTEGYAGSIFYVSDFEKFVAEADNISFIKVVESDPGRRHVTLDFDWETAPNAPAKLLDNVMDVELRGPAKLPSKGDADYLPKLAELLTSGDEGQAVAAGKALLKVDTARFTGDLKKQVARGYLKLVKNTDFDDQAMAVRGLEKFAGRYAARPLAKLVGESDDDFDEKVYETLARFPTHESAVAIAKHLSTVDAEFAAEALIKIGPTAEKAVGEALKTTDIMQAMQAIAILERIGTKESLDVLAKARDAGNPLVKDAAVAARAAIRKRSQD